MKKLIVAAFVTGLFLINMSGIARALTMTDVVQVDDLLFSADLGNSGDPGVSLWVQSVLGSGYTLGYKDSVNMATDWTLVDGQNKVFAYDSKDDSLYFLVKIGTGSFPSGTANTYLFQNLDSLNYAVISYQEMFADQTGVNWTANNIDVGRISHVSEINGGTPVPEPVPEPATMLLFGTGLFGLAAARLRRKKK